MYQTQNTQKYGVYLHKIKKKSQEYQEKVTRQLSADEPRSVFRRFVTTYTGPHTSAGAHLDIDTGEEDNKWGGGNIYLELGDTQADTGRAQTAAECGV